MKKKLILCCLFLGFFTNSWSRNEDWKPLSHKDFIIGTHYYGLAEYSWPINYLNSIKKDTVKADLERLKDLGFDTIILLASWSEFEPSIGYADEDVYKKINFIIKAARSLGLDVIIRIPYLWSLDGLEIRERIAYALLGSGTYRKSLLKFLKEFDRKVAKNNDNIVMKFGSWEDLYVLRDFFFSSEPVISEMVRQAFTRDTGIDAIRVYKNGKNYDRLMGWIDGKILQLTKEIGNYGYEIRTDSDPFIMGDKQLWYSHSDFYKNDTNGSVVAYWAPYFGQINNGESINSEKAIKSFSWMLESIAAKTPQVPFIDQLNFFDNSPGTEKNAKILENEYQSFFEKLSLVVAERTAGYALWTIKDYSHNIIFNPAFSEGLKGWSGKNITSDNSGVSIFQGGYLTQKITRKRFLVLKEKKPTLVVNVASGDVEVEVESVGSFDLIGPGRHEIPISSVPQGDIKITVRPKLGRGNAHVLWVSLYGHTQNGKVLDRFGSPSDFYDLIGNFNHIVARYKGQKCRGFKSAPASQQYMARGFFSDGWAGTLIEFCMRESRPAAGFRLLYANPSLEKRAIKVSASGVKSIEFALIRGEGALHICPPRNSSLESISISVFPPFVPAIEDKASPDLRNLGVFIKKVEQFECQKREGVW